MKRILATVTVVVLVITASLSVYAAETSTNSNMTGEVYRETRTNQVMEAHAEGLITDLERDDLLQHISDVVEEGLYGQGPLDGDKGVGNAECILGENDLGIFRSGSAGQRTGEGNGIGLKAQDGTGTGQANGVSGGRGNGNKGQGFGDQGLQDGSAQGTGFRGQSNNDECLLED